MSVPAIHSTTMVTELTSGNHGSRWEQRYRCCGRELGRPDLPCKFITANGSRHISHALARLSFIKQMKESGVNIIVSNNSWGGGQVSQKFRCNCGADGGWHSVRCSAGNDFSDNDLFPTFPANTFLPYVISRGRQHAHRRSCGFFQPGPSYGASAAPESKS